MKPTDKILTYEQARELHWFCKNVTGLRQEYYPLVEKWEKFEAKIDRLMKTCETIESYFKTHPELDPDKWFDELSKREGKVPVEETKASG